MGPIPRPNRNGSVLKKIEEVDHGAEQSAGHQTLALLMILTLTFKTMLQLLGNSPRNRCLAHLLLGELPQQLSKRRFRRKRPMKTLRCVADLWNNFAVAGMLA